MTALKFNCGDSYEALYYTLLVGGPTLSYWFPDIHFSIYVVLSAILIIDLGSFKSLKLLEVSKDKKKDEDIETMTSKDAYMFPVFASAALFGLYVAIKFLGKEYLNLLLGAYFAFIGAIAIKHSLYGSLKRMIPWAAENEKSFTYRVPVLMKESTTEVYNAVDVTAYCISFTVGFYYFMTKHWLANNAIGVSLSVYGVESISLGNFSVGAILLGLLFFYDIFWVFGTEVMVTVAKNIDIPIKLIYPRDLAAVPPQFSMIGLGDIVIPGVFVALCLRYDAFRSIKLKLIQTVENGYSQFPKAFYYSCLSGYFFGLVATMVAMLVFNAAQPALLYLVPGCLIRVFLCAAFKHDIKGAYEYQEQGEEEKKKEEEEKKTK
eukprot:CAMPEP_0115013102 /NCGR_PEP_ID=MMETSP0216-20121206/25184_1 /TAXON_ID=223996 /ORGANISM="Protocruzia adherens, Strain Boccale" /LENGTH=375 /DNA_ID=CAMNT_0002382389 /DNA_START=100 /DNA_END=1227 /DNA_ORIENTATION=+